MEPGSNHLPTSRANATSTVIRVMSISKRSSIGELQRLSLVSKVCTELDNHLGLSDRTLAEFIIHLADKFPDPPAFRHALAENGAEFPDSLSNNLLRMIGAMKPSALKEKGKAEGAKPTISALAPRVPRNETEARFPGLAMANTNAVELDAGFREVTDVKRRAKEEEEAAAASTVSTRDKGKVAAADVNEEDQDGADWRRRKRNRYAVLSSVGVRAPHTGAFVVSSLVE